MKLKDSAKESKALLEARAWKRQVSDLIREKGWDEFMRHAAASEQRWNKRIEARSKFVKV